ncbi:MAG TPA: hypothetical protein VJ851_16035 [Jatrophihabitans sp.]|nr:hypothetical protein [Jatrophihabitans sp.]
MSEQRGLVLLAMAPSGETFLVRDRQGTVWLVLPPGAGLPQQASGQDVEDAVARHGWNRIDREYTSWSELDAGRQQLVVSRGAQARVDVSGFDAEDVRRVLGVISGWRQRGDAVRGRRVLHKLLREAPIVRRQDELYEAVNEALKELDAMSPEPPPTILWFADHPRHLEAQDRLKIPVAA